MPFLAQSFAWCGNQEQNKCKLHTAVKLWGPDIIRAISFVKLWVEMKWTVRCYQWTRLIVCGFDPERLNAYYLNEW